LPAITLTIRGYADHENPFYNAIIDMWRETLGAEVVVEHIDPDHYTESFHAVDSHIVGFGWCADYPDPENFLDLLFHSGSAFNLVGYENPEIDAMLEEARGMHNPAERLERYQQIERLLLQDAALLPLSHIVDFMLVKPHISGYQLMPAGIPVMHLLALETERH
jgi:ABC-type oligopeptide transport system substrate-binding subunit